MHYWYWLIGTLAGFLVGWLLASNLLVVWSARVASEIMFAQIYEWRELLQAAVASDEKYKDQKLQLILDLMGRELGV